MNGKKDNNKLQKTHTLAHAHTKNHRKMNCKAIHISAHIFWNLQISMNRQTDTHTRTHTHSTYMQVRP